MTVRLHHGRGTGRRRWTHGARRLRLTLAAGLAVLAPACDDASTTPTPAPVPALPAPPDTQPPGCGDLLELEFLGRNEAAGTARGTLTLRGLDEWDATLDFVQPYTIMVPEGGANLDIPGLSPTLGVFVSGLRFNRRDGWFEQAATLEWVTELEIRATAVGCDPAVVSCDSRGCVTRG